jgi:hypothetical protein
MTRQRWWPVVAMNLAAALLWSANAAATCDKDMDCPGDSVCEAGVCQPALGVTPCTADLKCPSGGSCVNGRCTVDRKDIIEPPPIAKPFPPAAARPDSAGPAPVVPDVEGSAHPEGTPPPQPLPETTPPPDVAKPDAPMPKKPPPPPEVVPPPLPAPITESEPSHVPGFRGHDIELARDLYGSARGRQIAAWVLFGVGAGVGAYTLGSFSIVWGVRQGTNGTSSTGSSITSGVFGGLGMTGHIVTTGLIAVGGPIAAWSSSSAREGLAAVGEPEPGAGLRLAGWITWGVGTGGAVVSTALLYSALVSNRTGYGESGLEALSYAAGLTGIVLLQVDSIIARSKLSRYLDAHPEAEHALLMQRDAPALHANLTIASYGRAAGPAIYGTW